MKLHKKLLTIIITVLFYSMHFSSVFAAGEITHDPYNTSISVDGNLFFWGAASLFVIGFFVLYSSFLIKSKLNSYNS